MVVQSVAEGGNNFLEMEKVDLTDSELVYHVRNALKASLEGDNDSYNQLVGVLHHSERLLSEEVALLVTCLKALSGAVSSIDIIHHRSLLAAISGMSLWNYSTDVMDALVELLISMAGSNGQYIDLCLDMLVRNFMPPYSFIELLKQPRGFTRKDNVLNRVHTTLKDIYDLVPLSPLRLQRIIKDRMPNIFTEESLIVIFVENMLRLESSAMGELVGSTMLVAIVDRLVDLDVEISWEDILQENFDKGIFEMELEDLEGMADEPELEGDEPPGKIWRERFLNGDLSVAQKLDSLMVLTFEHLRSSNEGGRLHRVFETLLQSFQKTVITAYKSKFAQFVMFYACSLDPDDCGTRFAVTLISIFESSAYPELRMSSAAYLASYLSRAKFIPASFVANMIERLVTWCSDYCGNQDGDMNPMAHKVFYAAFQAIIYVLCFRMKSIAALPRLRSQLKRLDYILKHPLNPLKVCLPSIVDEFLRLAKQTSLFTLPDNLVNDGMLESDLSMAFGGRERLDMFFPFDPCLLKRTDRFIRPNFVYWSMVQSSYYDDDNEVTSDEDIAHRSKAFDNGTEVDEDSDLDLDEFDCSLDKMSITPKKPSNLPFGFRGDLRGHMQMPSRLRPSTSPESL